MTPDMQLMLVFGGLHVIALAAACLMFWMFLRAETVKPWEPSDEDENGDGGGGNDRLSHRPKPPRPGGLPLPDAVQASLRLRGEGRLADAHRRERRPHREPVRTPERV